MICATRAAVARAMAGLVVGARVPVMLTSRADGAPARLLSCALAVLLAHWQRTGTSAVTTAP